MWQARTKSRRGGFTLLELVVTAALAATLGASVFVLLRTSQSAWEAHHSDLERLEGAHAAIRHLVRNIRQATAVKNISKADDADGSLSLLMPSGEIYVWQHTGTQILFGLNDASSLLAENIQALYFTCYTADGVTLTTDVGAVQCVDCVATVQLANTAGTLRTVRCRAWRRSW
ncbi:MAG: prepilin-type N-terminal cleavage/methylation domain-containing protein [Pirellulales bacterium]|nr:prepilin-type N-terminal cleavage/methylation domain-containing protein [Pirellulales bacterium]